jgi:transcriptional regulator of met regulon
MRHVIDGLKHATGARNWTELHYLTGIPLPCISRIRTGKQDDITLQSLLMTQEKTELPFEQLIAWYRLPDYLTLSGIALMELAA